MGKMLLYWHTARYTIYMFIKNVLCAPPLLLYVVFGFITALIGMGDWEVDFRAFNFMATYRRLKEVRYLENYNLITGRRKKIK